MVRLLCFRDHDPWYRPDSSGFNKYGYVTEDGLVLHPRRTRMAKTPLDRITRKHHQVVDLSTHRRAEQIAAFFERNVPNRSLFHAGVNALAEGTHSFWDTAVRLPILDAISPLMREERWLQLQSTLQPGDQITTLDTLSFVSRMIAYVDQGTWSHIGAYSGDGAVIEAISAGVVERPIEVYHDFRYRIGVYRHAGAAGRSEQLIGLLRSELGKPYKYRGVLRLGVRKILGISSIESPKDMSPNDLVSRIPVPPALVHIV
jgi:hypothetical protein